MAKPICVIRISEDAQQSLGKGGKRIVWYELQDIFVKMLPDYHVFVIPMIEDRSQPQEFFTFQVFYEKDFTETDYEGLRELISKSLN